MYRSDRSGSPCGGTPGSHLAERGTNYAVQRLPLAGFVGRAIIGVSVEIGASFLARGILMLQLTRENVLRLEGVQPADSVDLFVARFTSLANDGNYCKISHPPPPLSLIFEIIGFLESHRRRPFICKRDDCADFIPSSYTRRQLCPA